MRTCGQRAHAARQLIYIVRMYCSYFPTRLDGYIRYTAFLACCASGPPSEKLQSHSHDTPTHHSRHSLDACFNCIFQPPTTAFVKFNLLNLSHLANAVAHCAFPSIQIFAPIFSNYCHMLSLSTLSLSLFLSKYSQLNSTDSFLAFYSICSYTFYIQIMTHKVGI